MKKHKKNDKDYPDPYEDIVRLEKLDAYETSIKSLFSNKKRISF